MFRAPPAAPPRAPDFLCVGTQRAGTTWLFRCLARDPGYVMPYFKELDAFATGDFAKRVRKMHQRHFLAVLHQELQKDAPDLAMLRWYARFTLDAPRDTTWYHSLFAEPPGRLTGDISPSLFGADAQTLARVRQSAPAARIVIMLRDPLDRAVSELGLGLRKGWWPADASDEERFRILTTGLSSTFSDYSNAVARWEAAYPGRVGIFFQEDIDRDPVDTLLRISAFLGRPVQLAAQADLKARVNAAPAVQISPALKKRLALWLAPRIGPLAGRFPRQVVPWVRHLAEASGVA